MSQNTPADFEYLITDGTGRETRIPLYMDNNTRDLAVPHRFDPPDWACLDHHQCKHCPLDTEEHRYCPVALRLAWAFSQTEWGDSYDDIELEVVTPTRRYSSRTSLQRALGSLFGLVCSLSPCPHTLPLRPMGIFHLPLADESETFFRAASVFLLHRYLQREQDPSLTLDLSLMEHTYYNLREINRSFAARLRGVQGAEAATNAIILLDMLTRDVAFQLEEQMPHLRRLFGMQ